MVTVLGAGGVLAAVLSATGPAALAQPASAQAPSLPKACVAIEALVGDGASGSSLGAGEVLRVSPGGQSTLTTNTAPMGTPNLDDPTDMAFLSNGDIVVTDESFTAGRPDVVEVNPSHRRPDPHLRQRPGLGPALVMPGPVAVEASGYILVTDIAAGTGNQRVLQIDPATGNRIVLTGNVVGSGPAVTVAAVGLENGVIYVTDVVGDQIMSVDPATGARTLVSGPGRGTGPAFVSPISVTSDSPDSVVVLDTDFSAGTGLGRGALIRVDLASGNRTVLSDDATPAGGQQFDNPIDVRYNACEKAFYVLQTGFTPAAPAGRVLKVDAATGARTLFASYLGAENYALLLRPIPVPSGGPILGYPRQRRDTPGSRRPVSVRYHLCAWMIS